MNNNGDKAATTPTEEASTSKPVKEDKPSCDSHFQAFYQCYCKFKTKEKEVCVCVCVCVCVYEGVASC